MRAKQTNIQKIMFAAYEIIKPEILLLYKNHESLLHFFFNLSWIDYFDSSTFGVIVNAVLNSVG